MGEFPNDDTYSESLDHIEIEEVYGGLLALFPPTANHISRLHEFVIVIAGRIRYRADAIVDGVAVKTDIESLNDVYNMGIPSNASYKRLMNLRQEPLHVTGVVIKPVSYYIN